MRVQEAEDLQMTAFLDHFSIQISRPEISVLRRMYSLLIIPLCMSVAKTYAQMAPNTGVLNTHMKVQYVRGKTVLLCSCRMLNTVLICISTTEPKGPILLIYRGVTLSCLKVCNKLGIAYVEHGMPHRS